MSGRAPGPGRSFPKGSDGSRCPHQQVAAAAPTTGVTQTGRMSDVVVQDNPAEARVEARVDGELAGFAAYVDREATRVFTHTEVDPAYGGQGVGGAIARGALDGARASGRSVVPLCPFIKGWIEKHPDYADLVATT